VIEPIAVAYGGGVNSTAMLVEMRRRDIVPDLILFADTGGELPETYDAIKTVSAWCVSHGFPAVVTVQKTYQGRHETLEENCRRMNMLPSIAYGFKSCSLKHKVEPQDKFCNSFAAFVEHWKSGGMVPKFIGYDAGESRRAKIQSDAKYSYRYPLIEWGLFREDCVGICEAEGLPVSKSACFFCPSSKKREVLELSENHPVLFARAIEMERNAELITVKGLGRSWSWSDFVRAEESQQKLFLEDQREIPCGCYDG